MTTNTNPSRTAPARFFASATTNGHGLYELNDRTDPRILVAIKGRAEARRVAAVLNSHDELVAEGQPAPALDADAQATHDRIVKRTSHAACEHVATKLARAICRREAAKAAHADS